MNRKFGDICPISKAEVGYICNGCWYFQSLIDGPKKKEIVCKFCKEGKK